MTTNNEIVNKKIKNELGFTFSYSACMAGVAIAFTLLWVYSIGILGAMSKIQAAEAYIVIALLTVGGTIGIIWYGE